MNISRNGFLLLFSGWLPLMADAASALPTQAFTLDNGLKVVVREDHRSPAVTAQLWLKVGASYEPHGQSGVSHALEHMVYKGSSKACAGEFAAQLEKLGAYENAATGKDFTVFYQTLNANRLGVAFEILADLMSTAELNAEDFAAEQQVIQEERRQTVEDDVTAVSVERLYSIAYPSSSHRTPVIGWMHDLQRMKVGQLQQWYRTWYAPNNATLVVVGDVQPDQVRALAQRYMAQLKRREVPANAAPIELATPGERSLTLHGPVSTPQVIMSFNTPSLATAPDRRTVNALRLLNTLLAGSNSARIKQQMHLPDSMYSRVASEFDPFNRGDSLLTIHAHLKAEANKTPDEAFAQLWKVIDELKSKAPQAAELNRAKTILMAASVYAQDELSDQASTIGILESIGLSWRLADRQTEDLAGVTAHDIQQAAITYLTRERLSTVQVLPEKKNG